MSKNNTEMAMRFATSVKNGDGFYTDLNGFQVAFCLSYIVHSFTFCLMHSLNVCIAVIYICLLWLLYIIIDNNRTVFCEKFHQVDMKTILITL